MKRATGIVFLNCPGDRDSISNRFIPNIQKIILNTSLLNSQPYQVRIKSKWSKPGKGVMLSPTFWCCTYWKGTIGGGSSSISVGKQLVYIYIYIYIYTSVFEWHKRFKEGRESVRDDERFGRSKEVNRPELIGQRIRVRVRVTMLRF